MTIHNSNFQTHFTDVKGKMRRRHKQTSRKRGFHGEIMVSTNELERANDFLINIAQTSMTDKDQITTLMWKLA